MTVKQINEEAAKKAAMYALAAEIVAKLEKLDDEDRDFVLELVTEER